MRGLRDEASRVAFATNLDCTESLRAILIGGCFATAKAPGPRTGSLQPVRGHLLWVRRTGTFTTMLFADAAVVTMTECDPHRRLDRNAGRLRASARPAQP